MMRARTFALCLAILLAGSLGCIEFGAIIMGEYGVDSAGQDNSSTSNGSSSSDSSSDETDEVGPDAPEDTDTNGEEDTDTNGEEDTDTNGEEEDLDANLPEIDSDLEMVTTDSGLQYKELVEGTGEYPLASSTVTVNYTGYLVDGTEFDSGTSVQFSLAAVVEGFSEGITGMREGGSRRLYIPPDLGYGENGNASAGIGGEDTIIFDVDLISIDN